MRLMITGNDRLAEDIKELGRLTAANQPVEALVSKLGEELLATDMSEGAVTTLWALNYKVGPLAAVVPTEHDHSMSRIAHEMEWLSLGQYLGFDHLLLARYEADLENTLRILDATS